MRLMVYEHRRKGTCTLLAVLFGRTYYVDHRHRKLWSEGAKKFRRLTEPVPGAETIEPPVNQEHVLFA